MGREPPHDRRPRRGRVGHHDNVARKLRLRCRFETLILQRAIGEAANPSGAKFPACRENAGNFTKIGPRGENMPDRTQQNQLVRE